MTVQYSPERRSPQSAPESVPPQVGDVFHVAGCLLTFRATGAETGDAYCLVDARGLFQSGGRADAGRHGRAAR